MGVGRASVMFVIHIVFSPIFVMEGTVVSCSSVFIIEFYPKYLLSGMLFNVSNIH